MDKDKLLRKILNFMLSEWPDTISIDEFDIWEFCIENDILTPGEGKCGVNHDDCECEDCYIVADWAKEIMEEDE